MKKIIRHCIVYASITLASCSPQLAMPAETVPETVYQTIALEAGGEGLSGMALVGRVIVNRARASGRSLEGECLRPYQFSAWNKDSRTVLWRKRWLDKHYTDQMRQMASNALELAMYDMDQVKFDHYHAIGVFPEWARGKEGHRVGGHVFYRLRG